MRRHVLAVAAVDDEGIGGAEAAGGARGIHGSVAAAIDDDAATEQRRRAGAGLVQHVDGIEHAGRVTGRDIDVLADPSADGDEDRIEAAGRLFGHQVLDLAVGNDLDPHRLDAGDVGHQLLARQAVGGDAEMHHAAGERTGLVDLDGVAEPGQMIGRRQARGPGADHQHFAAARRGVDPELPVFPRREVAEETFHHVDGNRRIDFAAIAAGFARMVADAPVHGRHRVVGDQQLPRLAVFPLLRQGQPALDVLAGRAGIVAGRQQVGIDRPARAHRSRALPGREVHSWGHIRQFGIHGEAPLVPANAMGRGGGVL